MTGRPSELRVLDSPQASNREYNANLLTPRSTDQSLLEQFGVIATDFLVVFRSPSRGLSVK